MRSQVPLQRAMPATSAAFVALAVVALSSGAGASRIRRAAAITTASSAGESSGGEFSPTMTVAQFLFVSSPAEKKVCWTELENFKSTEGRVQPLIDSGLEAPNGIALDRINGHLYVADYAAKKIFRYRIKVKTEKESDGTEKKSMSSDGVRLTVLEGFHPRWLSVDPRGDLIFTNEDANSVNRLPYDTIEKIASGEVLPKNLVTVAEKDLEATSAALTATATAVDEEADPKYEVFSLYEAGTNPHLAVPSGVYTDGVAIYWGNKGSGTEKGSVVEGSVQPTAPLSSATTGGIFETSIIANNTDQVYGVVKTRGALMFADELTRVYGVALSGGSVYELTDKVGEPRGLVWDGDNTVYIADQQSGKIWSMPSGRLSEGQPIEEATQLNDAFGLALLTERDEAFKSSAQGQGPGAGRLTLVAAAALALAAGALAAPEA